jgi:ferredoxin
VKVWVDPDKCQGHARCIQAVPEIFNEDEQGHAFTSEDDVPEESKARARQAERNCPEQAIRVTE